MLLNVTVLPCSMVLPEVMPLLPPFVGLPSTLKVAFHYVYGKSIRGEIARLKIAFYAFFNFSQSLEIFSMIISFSTLPEI